MPTLHTSLVHHSGTMLGLRLIYRYRAAAVAGAALTGGLLLGGCNGVTPAEAAPSKPTVTTTDAFGEASQQRDTAGVVAVVAAWDAAWNAGDSRAIGALFTNDAEFINGRGQIALGGATIATQHEGSLAGPFRGSRTQGRIRAITFLSATAAVVDVDNELRGYQYLPAGTVATEPGVQQGRHKRVVVKQGSTWRIVSMQITTVAPTPPAG
jgi:uncharacterized protein (TIGR02246 family)